MKQFSQQAIEHFLGYFHTGGLDEFDRLLHFAAGQASHLVRRSR
jgi:hypothetical protein